MCWKASYKTRESWSVGTATLYVDVFTSEYNLLVGLFDCKQDYMENIMPIFLELSREVECWSDTEPLNSEAHLITAVKLYFVHWLWQRSAPERQQEKYYARKHLNVGTSLQQRRQFNIRLTSYRRDDDDDQHLPDIT